jgi:hypothetical protein
MLLHEAGHAAGFMKDFAYAYERVFEFIKPENKFQMPDGYVGVTLELNKELRKEDVETPEIGKKDEVKCEGSQETLAKKSVALVERWLKDSLTSVRELYDKSHPDFMPAHIATVKTHFDPDFSPENTRVLSALFARYQELQFPLVGKLKINCVSELKSLSPLGGFWSESSSGLPGDSLFLLSEFFQLARDEDKAALLVAEMLATASGFIEPRHRRAFARMAQSFNKTQNRVPWRKED